MSVASVMSQLEISNRTTEADGVMIAAQNKRYTKLTCYNAG